MKMKVRVDKLQAAINKHVAQDRKRFERESVAFAIAKDKYRSGYIENVRKYLGEISVGGEITGSYYDLERRLERGLKSPKEPKPVNEYRELLVKLDLAEDQVLTVDDHSDYMRFLDGKCSCNV